MTSLIFYGKSRYQTGISKKRDPKENCRKPKTFPFFPFCCNFQSLFSIEKRTIYQLKDGIT